ncbi:MAG: 1-(5-phosphoribosyl)-5-[(5-phosphoribosylamino)methylideneamino]imidazole-4-carboxamide isomerase [Solirubrobacteraceae bacterium]|nr:1-(5-phosphoribosyl)-5-[(5-phosphoribosylamino)methylideneamino]imidazole-4-carboxamide isomerase [Solirubrobacteraceae bacterium]
MILYPAIDILEGQAVRLVRGEFDQSTVYRDSPLEAARSWVEAGARFLHIVDLDGARHGEPHHLDQLDAITSELDVPVQWGGGLRTPEAVREALRAGAERVILGTAAINDLDLLDTVMGSHRDRVMVSIDTRGGKVATAGWQETTSLDAPEVITRLQHRGVRRFVYTNADRDGLLEGPDMDEVRRIADAVRGSWIFSGGIGTVEHLRQLHAARLVNLSGAITGKAIYENKFTIAEGQAALQGK